MTDATPSKLLLMLVAREGCSAALRKGLSLQAPTWFDAHGSSIQSLTGLSALEEDPFATQSPPRGLFDITLEPRVKEGSPNILSETCATLVGSLRSWIEPSQSIALVGSEKVFLDGGPMPVRYQYLMRRRAETTHDRYIAYYRDHHSQFGIRTPGINGYVQVYVDEGASQSAARSAGLGTWHVDSVSELHMESVQQFLSGVMADPALGQAATADEERFVDRANSVMFTSKVLFRLGNE